MLYLFLLLSSAFLFASENNLKPENPEELCFITPEGKILTDYILSDKEDEDLAMFICDEKCQKIFNAFKSFWECKDKKCVQNRAKYLEKIFFSKDPSYYYEVTKNGVKCYTDHNQAMKNVVYLLFTFKYYYETKNNMIKRKLLKMLKDYDKYTFYSIWGTGKYEKAYILLKYPLHIYYYLLLKKEIEEDPYLNQLYPYLMKHSHAHPNVKKYFGLLYQAYHGNDKPLKTFCSEKPEDKFYRIICKGLLN